MGFSLKKIFKGSGGGGKVHTPVEAKESGRSKQLVNISEILSEGEIEGLADGMKSVFFDNTPVQNADGSYNFKNVQLDGCVGAQKQDLLDGFNTSQKEVTVNTQIRRAQPITRTITDNKISRLRLTLGVQSLFKQETNGDTNSTKVELKVYIGTKVYPVAIEGKYSSAYTRSYLFTELPKVPFTVRVERVTADSTEQRLQNNTVWSSYTEIIDTEFTYPNTALVGVKFDSEYFSNLPNRTYDVKGIKLKVPSNYNPETREYKGLWDGTFKIAWSDNPAWVLYDIVTNKRYGLGERVGEMAIDKWTLYQVAQYCDQLVPDGFGGTEPRFTCNAWLTEQRAAYDVINDICSIFRAMPVWNGRELTVVMDRPADPVWTYTNANVENGEFTYTFSAKKSRHNAIQVEYADKDNAYEKTIEYVSDDDSIRKNGLNVKKVTAFGCTSRGQAHRTGLWLLQTEKLETKTVSFTVGAEGLMHTPGDIIKVADVDYAGTNIGGRVLKVEGKKVTLDREINPEHYTANSFFTYINKQAKHQDIRIVALNGAEITLDRTPEGLTDYGVWSLTTQKINTQLFRALSVKEEAKGKYSIVALQHEPQKEAIVDNGAKFEPKPTLVVPRLGEIGIDIGPDGRVRVGADVSDGDGAVLYDIRLYRDGTLVDIKLGQKSPDMRFDELENGSYTVIIIAKNASGRIVSEKSKTFTIDRPPVPRDVRVLGGLGNISISWAWVNDVTMTEIFAAETDDIRQAKRIAKVNAMFFSHEVGAQQVRYYWVRHTRGVNVGPFYQQSGLRGESSVDIDQELKLLNEKLSKNIINEVFDTAAPARKLGMTLYVESLKDVNTYAGQKQVYDETANQMYTWNGTKYVPLETELLASKIKGIIEPSQLAAIPTTKLSGKLTDAQIQALSATKLIGTLNIATVPNIPANKLTGLLALDRLPNMPVSKLSGKVAKNQLDNALIGELTTAQNTANAANTLANTIKTQVEQETANRIKAIQAEAQARDTALSAEVANRTKAIASESANLTAKIQAEAKAQGTAVTQLQNVDKQQAQQITALTAKADNALSGLEAEKTARANGDKAEAKAREALTARMGTAESNIANVQKSVASANQSISEVSQNLSAKIDGLSVGGRNYASDGKFELGQWEYSTGNANDRISHVEDGIVRVTGKTTTWKQWQLHARMGSLLNNSKRSISLSYLQPNEKYTLSFEARCVSGNPNIWTRIRANTDASRPDNPDVYRKDFMLTEEWQKYRHTAILPAVDGLDYWRLIFGYSQIGIVEYRNIKLELGTIATDWTPAPEDVEGDIAKVSANLTAYQATQATKEQATATQLNGLTTRLGTTESSLSSLQSTKANKNEVASIAQSSLQATWKADAKAEVDKVQVGGRNYLLDSLFSQRKWNFSQGASDARATCTVEDGVVTISSTNTTWKQYQLAGYNFDGGMNLLEDGAKVTFSFEVMTPDDNANGNIKYWANLRADRNNGEASINPVAHGQKPAPNKWTRVSVTGTATQPTNMRGWRFILATTTAGTVKFRRPKLEIGTIATDWTPAPEDVENSVNTVSAKIDTLQTTLSNADKALSTRIDTVTSSVNNTTAQISTVSKAVADVNGKLTATHTIKTQAIAGSRTAIAGISLGANKEQGSVIVMADKFQVVKNAQDNAPKSMLSVINNQMAINGDLIASGQITAAKLATNAVTSDKVAANAITSAKIAANAIESNKIKAGAVVAGKLAANAVVANNLAANVVTAEKIAAGAITAQKMSANSVGANALQAGAVVAGKLAANSVDAGNIKAGAINANHVSAGQISADKLAIGLGGNLLYNPIFANGGDGWRQFLNNGAVDGTDGGGAHQFRQRSDTWGNKTYLPNENLLTGSINALSPSIPNGARIGGVYSNTPVIPGKWYMLSCYVGCHRGTIAISSEFRTQNGGWVGIRISKYSYAEFVGGLRGAERLSLLVQAPGDAVSVDFFISVYKTTNTENVSWYAQRPMLEECTEHTREPSPWQNAGVTAIHGGSIVTKTITAQQIAAGAVTANEIAAGTITGNKIASRTITANQIATKSITANEMSVGSLSAISSNIGHVTAGTITGTSITGNNISGGSIWGTSISGTTISGTTIEGGTIKGARLEGATGKFTGELEVTQLIGGGVIEHVTGKLSFSHSIETTIYVPGYTVGYTGSNPGQKVPRTFSQYVFKKTVSISSSKMTRYVTVIGANVASFNLPAGQSKIFEVNATFNSKDEGEKNGEFMVLAYALTDSRTITIN